MSEVFDDDLKNYQNKLSQDDEDSLTDPTYDCMDYNVSGCCNAPFWNDTDVCSKCLEHADTGCQGCEQWSECSNENQNRYIYK